MRELNDREIEQVSGGVAVVGGLALYGPLALAFAAGYGAGTVAYEAFTTLNGGSSLGDELYKYS